MKIGFEIYFENDEMTVNAPNLFVYEEDASTFQATNYDSRRISAEAIERTMRSRKVYDKLLRLSRSLEKEVQK